MPKVGRFKYAIELVTEVTDLPGYSLQADSSLVDDVHLPDNLI